MADSLQSVGSKALEKAPQPLRRALGSLGTQFREEDGPTAPLAGGLGPDNRGMIAGVAKGSPNVVSVMQPETFRENAPQLVTHEGVHEWQNNLPPSIQAKIPADNAADPYNYGGTQHIQQLVHGGGSILDLPREQQAAAMQYGQAQGMPEPYKSLAGTMDKVPLSTIDETDPNAKLINTHPRSPQVPPGSVPGMNFAGETYKKGQPAPGDPPPPSGATIDPAPPAGATLDDENAVPAVSADSRNAFQRYIDNATGPVTPEERAGHGKLYNAALDFGQGAAQTMLSPLAHPIETAKGIAAAATPDPGMKGLAEGALLGPAGPTAVHGIQSVYGDAKQNGLARALGTLGGGFATGEATGGLIRGAGEGMESAGSGLNNFVLGTKASDIERGANPGRALSSNHIWGSNPSSLLSGVKEKIPDIASEHRNVVTNMAPLGATVNAGKLVSEPFDTRVSTATDPTTGVSMPSQVNRARLTQRLLTHVQDPESGQVTPMMRNPNISPIQATDLKSSIYGMTDYDNPYKSSIANSALKDAAHGLKTQVENIVPESKASGQRLHDIMSAKDILTPQAEGSRLYPPNKAGLIDRGLTGATTGGAALLDAAGGGLQNAGDVARYATAPLLVPGARRSGAQNGQQ